jgi:aryl-alcohol dehydrogenase-like predicted oxidoreductase
MEYNELGDTGIRVSSICLGSMTWGEQNSEAEGHGQLDMALDRGVNFVDTAEMYPIPSREQTYGVTETIIGNWLSRRKQRDKIVIATKVVGPASEWMPHIRNGQTRLNKANILQAVESSLSRLQTDYVDLYQVHWPERGTNYFGKLGYEYSDDDDGVDIEETLNALSECVGAGKVRAIGVSNETPWGVMRYLYLADKLGMPRIVTVQNPYSLLNRTYEIGLAEISRHEGVGLLAYSPLGFGVLTGKYLRGMRPQRARLTLFKQFKRYLGTRSKAATEQYLDIAERHGLNPAQMALAYVNSRPFLASSIIGATEPEQLNENLDSGHIQLNDEVLRDIELVHKDNPNPAP